MYNVIGRGFLIYFYDVIGRGFLVCLCDVTGRGFLAYLCDVIADVFSSTCMTSINVYVCIAKMIHILGLNRTEQTVTSSSIIQIDSV